MLSNFTNSRRGFTLVEILVVIGIFGILLVSGTDFFIQIVRNSNQATMKNEVRQNANKVLQEVTAEIRKSTGATFNAGTLTISYPDGSQASYTVNASGAVLKTRGGVTTTLTSTKVAFFDCPLTCGSCTTSGFSVSPASITPSSPATIRVVVQQNPARFTTTDFCARFEATDSATPRQY